MHVVAYHAHAGFSLIKRLRLEWCAVDASCADDPFQVVAGVVAAKERDTVTERVGGRPTARWCSKARRSWGFSRMR